MRHDQRDVIVVGGGISGLTAAWHLKNAGIDVCLLEAAPRVGGAMQTEHRDGFLLEKGPFNVIVRNAAFERLLEEVSDDLEVITADRAARARYIYRAGNLHAVPSHPIALLGTQLLTMSAKCRLLAGLCASRRHGAHEETIDQAATRRFGREVADTFVSAAISGIYAGDIHRLSLKACFPNVWRIDTKTGSPLAYGLASGLARVARSRRPSPGNGRRTASKPRRWRGLISIDGGLGELAAVLGKRLGADLHTRCRVETIRATDRGYALMCTTRAGTGQPYTCRRLLLAGAVQEAARLVAPLSSDAGAILRSIESASMVVLNLGFSRSDVEHPMKGYGFLVPRSEPDFPLMGVLWADSIFPHHAPPDRRLIRVFMGGSRDPEAASRTDDDLLARALGALRPLLRLSGDPVLIDVCRYRAAIPQYVLGYAEKINSLRSALSEQTDLHLIGNYLQGISINDCIRLATEAANQLIQPAG